MIFKDYYKILELETNNVTLNDIKTAYREQAKKYHPDVNVGNKNAEERFKDINEAYNTLANSTTKRKYDRMWNAKIRKKKIYNVSNKEKMSAKEEIISMLFGKKENIEKTENDVKSKKKVPTQGEDIATEIDTTIKEAFDGQTKKLTLKAVNGKMKTFDIKIPEGIRDGEKIRLLGQGKAGSNGGKNGNLLIKVNIKDTNNLKLIGADIHSNILITPWEAVLGTKVQFETIDETITIYIPKESQNGEEIEIKNKGYKKGLGERGNLILHIKIMVPKNVTEQEKELYKKLKEISRFNPRREYK